MKTITVHGLSLQFDTDAFTDGNDEAQAYQAMDMVNNLLKRQPVGLNARLIATRDKIDITNNHEED